MRIVRHGYSRWLTIAGHDLVLSYNDRLHRIQ